MDSEVKMKFFKPEDFKSFGLSPKHYDLDLLAHLCNIKLERNSQVVYGDRGQFEWLFVKKKDEKDFLAMNSNFKNSYYKALLINIEPIAKCNHPIEKIYQTINANVMKSYCKCECGVEMRPTAFEPIEKPCAHDLKSIIRTNYDNGVFSSVVCRCGKYLLPTAFEEIE
jgi:hypothetical protein